MRYNRRQTKVALGLKKQIKICIFSFVILRAENIHSKEHLAIQQLPSTTSLRSSWEKRFQFDYTMLKDEGLQLRDWKWKKYSHVTRQNLKNFEELRIWQSNQHRKSIKAQLKVLCYNVNWRTWISSDLIAFFFWTLLALFFYFKW